MGRLLIELGSGTSSPGAMTAHGRPYEYEEAIGTGVDADFFVV
ncbi:hypothetical protein [Streptomyces sp. NPDC006645]